MTEPAIPTPWWIIKTFRDEVDPDIPPDSLSSLLSYQLKQWSLRDAVRRGLEHTKWWQIDSLDLSTAYASSELYDNLRKFVLDYYPLRRRGGLAPSISGEIDSTKLTVALVGDVRDSQSRAYLHCLARFIRMEGFQLLDPIDIKVISLIYLPHNSHLLNDRSEIALFLTELHTMMLQPPADRPFDWVMFIQDKNQSRLSRQGGYEQLTAAQLIELMSQTLFHAMIGESTVLREIAQRFPTSYLSVGTVALYYNWDHHRQKLAESASQTLIDRFAHSKEPPFTNESEADYAIDTIKEHFLNRHLLKRFLSVTRSIFEETVSAESSLLSEVDSELELRTVTPFAKQDRAWPAYKQAASIAAESIRKGRAMLWKGSATVTGAEYVIVKSIRGIFEGRYGEGDARALEQALMVMNRLQTFLERERQDIHEEKGNYSDFVEQILRPFEPEFRFEVNETKSHSGPTMPALVLFQGWEWLLTVPLWGKILAGALAAAGSGYLFFRRLRARARKETELTEIKPVQVTKADQHQLEEELRANIKASLTHLYYQALTLTQKLEILIVSIGKRMDTPAPPSSPFYNSTTFCRSVFDDLVVPGRANLGPLISNGDFAPQLQVQKSLKRFEDLENTELHPLINEFAEKPSVVKSLAPPAIEESNVKELSVKSASELSREAYDFAYNLYGGCDSLGMDDALRHIRDVGTQEKFLEYAARTAMPPIIFGPTAAIEEAPYQIELKYHDPQLFESVFGDRLRDGRLIETDGLENNEILSLGIYQPIPLSKNAEFASLDSIHTIGAMRVPPDFAATVSPSLIFTLATLSPAIESALVSAIDGRRLPPAAVLGDYVAELKSHIARGVFPIRESRPEDQLLQTAMRRASRHVTQQMGPEAKWFRINQAVWQALDGSSDHSILLTDVDRIAQALSVDSDEVLALLSLLSSPASRFIEMGYFDSKDPNLRVSRDEVVKHLRAWWREGITSEEEWQEWGSNVLVKWHFEE